MYYTRHLECGIHGPEIASSVFRRLNSSQSSRLVIWNILGADDPGDPGPLLLVPSEDIRPTEGQRVQLESNLGLDQTTARASRTPLLSALLGTGLPASRYAIGSGGPLAYTGARHVGVMWETCDRIARLESFEHPSGMVRDNASSYMQPLWSIHERLVQEDRRDVAARSSGSLKRKAEDSLERESDLEESMS